MLIRPSNSGEPAALASGSPFFREIMPISDSRCAEYLRRAGSLSAARRLARGEGRTAPGHVWIRALMTIIGQEY